MRTLWAWWGFVLCIVGYVLGRYEDFINALALDRLILLLIGLALVIFGPVLVAALADAYDEDLRNPKNKKG